MDELNIISALEKEVKEFRTRYFETNGSEWFLLALSLRNLSEIYRAQGMKTEEKICKNEYCSVMSTVHNNTSRCECPKELSNFERNDIDAIKFWAKKESESRAAIKQGGSVIK